MTVNKASTPIDGASRQIMKAYDLGKQSVPHRPGKYRILPEIKVPSRKKRNAKMQGQLWAHDVFAELDPGNVFSQMNFVQKSPTA
jgi:hypothetical protein